mmetsp:Transcript_18236/g.56956  ORF Transcript_18236/g.56956 Transcript_18236/m.56956 type:complete len:291 (+) Transcript_18236:130-1002(+)
MRVTAATLAAVVAASSAADREGTIPAAVLTYDGRRALSRLMIERYERLWSTHPYRFFVPVQKKDVPPSFFGSRVTLVSAPDKGISATMIKLIEEVKRVYGRNAFVLFAADDKYPIHIDPSLASKVTNKVRDPTTTLAGIHLGCFRQSTATRAACKLERDAKPWKLRPCESFCKCFYCHHYERAWFLEAFFRYTLKAEQTGAIDHPKAFDLFKQRAMNHALATRPAGSVGEGFVAAAGEALVFEETSHKGKITEKTLGCLGASDAMDLDPRYLPAVHFNINPNYTCSWNHG